jgi:hypothetical protein
MADFRQLALEYVLAEEESKLTSLAQQSASGEFIRHESRALSLSLSL